MQNISVSSMHAARIAGRFRPAATSRRSIRGTIAALAERRFRSGFESGCSIGVLTRMLAIRCDALLAADLVEEPLQTARTLRSDLQWVRFKCLRIQQDGPKAASI
jgi:hypothetical protein